MVRAIVLTALVAAVASGLDLGNPVVGSNLARRTAAQLDDVAATKAPKPEPTSFEEDGQDPFDGADAGLSPAKADKADKTGARQPRTQQTDAPQGGDDLSFLDGMPAEDAGQTGVTNESLPTKTGAAGNNRLLETGYPEDGLDADQTGFPGYGNPSGVAAPTAGSNARGTDTPVLISEAHGRPVGQVTVLLGLGAVALAIGLS
ncbi:hypothetical protein G6O67_003596 [Ophiocordyceps sinensis]|uniref:Uncharacterized protein n=1 Tax=Ophiocordyceps sinensis TaxID=72228 RepID=A0A8H4V6H0_9HYPO|nr:hypothetical protein G6O67_003596 [Ophiocordyceps sinensis]